jgi:CheY-like chemotaxis protein
MFPEKARLGLGLEKYDNEEENYDPYVLIFTDCNMPIMDGLEMASEIRKAWE